MQTRIAWFRRDLRVADNPTLTTALDDGADEARVIPLFVLDPRLTHGSTMSPARLSYLCDALADLDGSLRGRGGRLVIRHGDPREVVPRVAEELGARQVHWARDVTPFAAARDRTVAATLKSTGVEVSTHPGVMIRDAGSITSGSGDAYQVYTPFRRAWQSAHLNEPLPPPDRVPVPSEVQSEALPTVASLGVEGRVPQAVPTGGEAAAGQRLAAFVDGRIADYGERRDALGRPGTSRLSADLHYGCLSPRAVYQCLDRRRAGHDRFAQELIWRDFYGHVMARWPEARTQELNPSYRELPWGGESEELTAWAEGRTGYPVVDAGMRQLLAEGWMHNRARMITASFLCKDLLIDWRLGDAHFLRHLVDGDVASNNGGWQWAAGTGTDAQPYFRIFNPVTQGKKFDPDGRYVRTYVPELRAVPDRWLHHPWDMPESVARESGVVIGREYPAPIVDHAQARRAALDWFAVHRRE